MSIVCFFLHVKRTCSGNSFCLPPSLSLSRICNMYVCTSPPHHSVLRVHAHCMALQLSLVLESACEQGVRDKASGKGERSKNLKVEQKPPVHSLRFASQWTLTFKGIAISSKG